MVVRLVSRIAMGQSCRTVHAVVWTEASHWCIVCGGTGRGELPEPQLTIAELYETTETVEERYERFHPPCVMCGGAGAVA